MDLYAPLHALAESDRFWMLDRLDRYYQNQQDATKRYDWDGFFITSEVEGYSPIAPGWYVPHTQRRPRVRYRLAYVVVSMLTEMALANPVICIEGDERAEEAGREYAKLACLAEKMVEVRNYGGAQGTGCASLAVVNGRFVIDVHNPKHVRVTQWADRRAFRPAEVLKAYRFQREEFDPKAARIVSKPYWYVQIWDQTREIVWEAIPDDLAARSDWSRIPPTSEIVHGLGFCPFYWVQNVPDSDEEDGAGDYEGSLDKLDEINRLASAVTRGTIRNVDPTLVIRDEDDGRQIMKGSGGVIFAKNGADYLELKGLSVDAAGKVIDTLIRWVNDEAGVVSPSEEKLTGAAQSAAAMRILYRRMIAKCDVLRAQYGRMITEIVTDMLRIAGMFRAQVIDTPDGPVRRVLSPDLDPGESEAVAIEWGEYFLPTSNDIKASVDTAKQASGGKSVISRKTAVRFVSQLFGVDDPEGELEEIEEDEEKAAENMRSVFGEPGEPMAGDDGEMKMPKSEEGDKPAG